MIKSYLTHSPKIAPDCYIAETAVIIGDVEIGRDCNIWDGVVIRGDLHSIRIGQGVSIQENTVLHIGRGENRNIEIADFVLIGHACILHGCKIAENALIGMGAILLDEAVIPKNTLVAAGSLVPGHKTFPPNSLLMGSPAKFVRTRTESEIKNTQQEILQYIELSKNYRA